ncbi:MAG: hypothetical protein Fur0019_02060 [Tibeticola sp.]
MTEWLQMLASGGLPVAASAAFGAAAALAWLIVRTQHWHLHLTGDHPGLGPQKHHEEATPRVGGLAILAGLMAGMLALRAITGEWLGPVSNHGIALGGLLLALLPLYALGMVEDLHQSVSVRLRLGLSLAAGAVAWMVAEVRIGALGLPGIDGWLRAVPLLGVVVTAVAVAGLVHAMNIIDGANGLLAGVSLAVFGALAWVAGQFGEVTLLRLAVLGAAAVAGFGLLNFPRGRLFCGDAGAYLIGFLCAALVVLLVARQPAISPWFALALVLHPVVETLYSAWRRFRQGMKPTEPDARHMHSLWMAVLRARTARGAEPPWLGPNAGATWRTLLLAALPTGLAAAMPTRQGGLQLLCVAYVALFVFVVKRLQASVEAPEVTADVTRPVNS